MYYFGIMLFKSSLLLCQVTWRVLNFLKHYLNAVNKVSLEAAANWAPKRARGSQVSDSWKNGCLDKWYISANYPSATRNCALGKVGTFYVSCSFLTSLNGVLHWHLPRRCFTVLPVSFRVLIYILYSIVLLSTRKGWIHQITGSRFSGDLVNHVTWFRDDTILLWKVNTSLRVWYKG